MNRGYATSLLGLLLMVLGACTPKVAVPPPAPPPPRAEGVVRGRTVLSGLSVPIEGATVSVGTRRGTVAADNSFSLGEIEPGKQHVVVEKLFSTGAVRRVLGIATIFVAENPVEIRVSVRDATDVDSFCLSCHPPLRKVTRRDQKARDAHPSGIVAVIAVGDRSLLDQRGRVTCESCHTAHGSGEHPFFGRGEIRKGTYCNRCHSSGGSG